jgi:hypothetical protein
MPSVESKENFQSFTMIHRKPHEASSICLRSIIFQNPEGTLWTHCSFLPLPLNVMSITTFPFSFFLFSLFFFSL